jgi:hypothetical protein
LTGPAGGGDRDVLVVLHPERPLVQVGGVAGPSDFAQLSGAEPPPWSVLLQVARRVAPAGAWPLGPHRKVAGFRLHVLQARQPSLSGDGRWREDPDPSWPVAVRDVVAAVLDEDAGRTPTPALRASWMRRGWWQEATDWVDARLAEAGRYRTGDLEPQEHWGVSAVARVPATGGALWLKAVAPMFRREPPVLAVLASGVPGRVPAVFAAQDGPAGALFLLGDAGPVPDEVAEGDRVRLAGLLADLQVKTLDLLPRLRAAGCADRSPAALCAGLARVAEDGFELDQLTPTERVNLRNGIPRLTQQLLSLDKATLPEVLVHGDFHPWNVARPPAWSLAEAVVIDWTDAAIGPAGIDLATLVPRSADDQAQAAVRRSYASVWADELGTSLAAAEAAVAATRPAAHVLQALAYDEILRQVEPSARWPLSGAMAGHLRALAETAART